MPDFADKALIDLNNRVKALERKKLKIKDLPLTALREAILTTEPQDPLQMLLPASITGDLLAEGVPKSLILSYYQASASLVTTETFTVIPGLAHNVNENARTLVFTSLDMGGRGLAELHVDGKANNAQLIAIPESLGDRCQRSQAWVIDAAKGQSLEIKGVKWTAPCTISAPHSILIVAELIS